ncbi:MAG: TolC family protein [Holosporales bacterium]|jgi:outer membrane protein|nr:TolC family protein [Holosporales bacterium]
MICKKFFVLILTVSPLCYSASSDGKAVLFESKVKNKATSKKSDLFFALENALKNNKEIISAQKALMSAHEEHVLNSSPFKPNISAKTGVDMKADTQWRSNIDTDDKTHEGKNTGGVKSYGVSVSQNIFNGLSDIAKLKETDLNIKAQWSEYEALKQKVLREVSELYFNIVAKKQEVMHLKTLLESRKSVVELATQMHSTGSVKYLDLAQAQADYATTEGKLSTAKAELESLRAQFEESVGIPAPIEMSIPEKLFDTNLTASKAKDIAMKYNPGIIAATDKLSAAKEAIKIPNPGLVPSVDTKYSFDQSLRHKDNNRGHTVSISVSIPIYDGGVGRAKKRQAIEKANQAAVAKEKAIQETKRDIIAVWTNMEAAKENLLCSKKAVEACQLALHDTEEEFKAGLKITKDVLEAQEKLNNAKFIETDAEKRYFISQCSANALLGRMNAKYLKLKDSDFDYKTHFAKTKTNF